MDTKVGLMQAVVYQKYGTAENLEIKEVEIPLPKANEVQVKVCAASINSWDWDLVIGKPWIVRVAGGGLFKPIKKILGCDIAGIVAAVGKNVTKFKAGDEVFGDISQFGWGGFAEYVAVNHNALIDKPKDMSFEVAASLPQAGVMALQGVHDYGKVKPGQKVLINGAGGGVGTFAIQLAKHYGAEITGVDRRHKFERMKSLGADHVIDFQQEDFTKNGLQYDLILDVVGHHSLFDFKKALSPNGVYRMIGGPPGLIFQTLIYGPLISMFGSKTMGILAHEPNKNLELLLSLIKEGKVIPIMDRQFPLNKLPSAIQYLGEGHAIGKVVISI